MQEIFLNYIETSFDGKHQSESKIRQFEKNYTQLLRTENCKKTLDIGIGRGEMLSCMRNLNLDYQGIDISPSTVSFCKTLDLNCALVDDTEIWLNSHPKSFDVITCLDVLEHIPKDKTISFLKSIRGSLSDGGIAIIQVPNLQCPEGQLHHFNDFTHLTGFVEHSLAQVLIAAEFKNYSFHGFEEIYKNGVKQIIRKILRGIFRVATKFSRRVHGNLNPNVLDPVMYVVAR